MATKRVSTREELQNMSRADLQKLAKDHNIKANMKTNELIDRLVRAKLAFVPPRIPPSSVRNERTGAQRNPDEQENLPTPKLTPTASSADRESAARLKGKDHIKSTAGKSRIPVPGGGRKVSGVRVVILPPAVVAAHPLPPPSESPSKTRGKVKKVERVMEKETTSPIRPYADEDHDMEGNPAPMIGNATPTDSLPSAGSTSQNPGPTLPASSLTSLLERRIVKLEKSSTDNQSTRQQDMSYLLAQLKEAQDDIIDLKQQNEDLKQRLDSEVATKKEMSDIINRLAELDDQLARMNIRPDPSVTSSEAELPYEAPMPPRKLEYQTPPSQIGLLVGRISNSSLAPAARIHPSASRRDKKERARHTPPPQPRQYPLNPDESPSPQRRSSTSLLPISGSVKRGSSAMGTPLTSTPLANSRNASPIAERSQKRQLLRDKRYSMMEEEMDGYQSDTPPRELNPVQTLAPIESQGDSEVILSPRPPLPFPIVASPSAAPVEIEAGSKSKKPSSSRRRSPTKITRGRRAHPYDVEKTRESASPEAGPSSLPDGERNLPNMKIPWFGETPDPSRAPGPSSFPGGSIPKLSLARSSLSGSAAMLMHDPIETPEYEEPRQVEETPPASRTRYGTEFRSTLKAKFSDSAPAWR